MRSVAFIMLMLSIVSFTIGCGDVDPAPPPPPPAAGAPPPYDLSSGDPLSAGGVPPTKKMPDMCESAICNDPLMYRLLNPGDLVETPEVVKKQKKSDTR